jgi:hypothetical protein
LSIEGIWKNLEIETVGAKVLFISRLTSSKIDIKR